MPPLAGGGFLPDRQPYMAPPSPPFPCYLLQVNEDYATFFVASSPTFHVARSLFTLDGFEPGKLYCVQATATRDAIFSSMPDDVKRVYTKRDCALTGARYQTVIDGLMLQQRLHDYAQSCAVVLNLSPLILSLPSTPDYIEYLFLRTESGDLVDVVVEGVGRGRNRMKVVGTPMDPLPEHLSVGDRLEMLTGGIGIQTSNIVTRALEPFHQEAMAIDNREVLNRIYGEEASYSHSPNLLKMSTGDGVIQLSAEHSKVIRRYHSTTPMFLVENTLHSEESMRGLQVAMARSYPERIQLFLAPTNHDVFIMAALLAGAALSKKILHIVSLERELAALLPSDRSPFSIFNRLDNPHVVEFNRLRDEFQHKSKRARRGLFSELEDVYDAAWMHHVEHHIEEYDIILATADMALHWRLKTRDPRNPCPLQKQLEERVARIVIMASERMSEAHINALVLNFKPPSPLGLQYVLFGRPTYQVPTFQHNELPSEFIARSAFEACRRSRNVPVIKLRKVYTPPTPIHLGIPNGLNSEQATIGGGIISHITVMSSDSPAADVADIVLQALQESGQQLQSGTVVGTAEDFKMIAETRRSVIYEVSMMDSSGRDPVVKVEMSSLDMTDHIAQFFVYSLKANAALRRHVRTHRLGSCEMRRGHLMRGDFTVAGFGPAEAGRSDREWPDPTRAASATPAPVRSNFYSTTQSQSSSSSSSSSMSPSPTSSPSSLSSSTSSSPTSFTTRH